MSLTLKSITTILNSQSSVPEPVEGTVLPNNVPLSLPQKFYLNINGFLPIFAILSDSERRQLPIAQPPRGIPIII